MKLSCIYEAEKIPVSYQMMFVSLIKQALKTTDEEYFNSLYKYEKNKTNKKSKNFCFSVYMKNFNREDNVFKIADKVILNISSPDYEFMINLYNGLLQIKQFKYKEFYLNKVKINLVKERKIETSSVVFNTLSPICVKDKSNNYLNIKDENFEKELNYIVDKTLENFRGQGLNDKLKFYPVNMRKRVVKEEIRVFKQNTNKKYYYVNAYSGLFKLEGNINDLKDIYTLGLGFKRNQGFGMIDVVS